MITGIDMVVSNADVGYVQSIVCIILSKFAKVGSPLSQVECMMVLEKHTGLAPMCIMSTA